MAVLLRAALAGLVLVGVGCTWTRFDELENDAPAVSLKKPQALGAGFGVTMTSLTLGDRARLLVGGSPGVSPAASYDVSRVERPIVDAIDAAHCRDSSKCFLAAQPAALARLTFTTEPQELCFALGIAETTPGERGVLLRCEDNTAFSMPLPEVVQNDVVTPRFERNVGGPVVLSLDADDEESPALVAGLVSGGHAWMYPAGSYAPVLLDPETRDDSFGRTVAVLATSAGRVFAIGAPEQGRTWLFRESEAGATPIGCLSGVAGFASVLTAGRVTADADDDLVVREAERVLVFDGAALATLPETATSTCSLSAPQAELVLASLGCRDASDVRGCATSEYGASVAVGDLDGDGDGEIAVGAPAAKVRDHGRAGAVYVYDVEGADVTSLAYVRFMSSASADDRLGAALAMPRVEGRSVLAAGVPGAGKTVLFYCSPLLSGDQRGGRCD